MKVYLDMDGVITDFVKALSPLGLKSEREDLKSLVAEKHIWEDYRFFENLEWMPDGKELWKFVKRFDPIILTSPGKNSNTEVIKGKILWLTREMPKPRRIFETEKFKFAEKDAILIDDYPKKIDEWVEAGGIGILHKNAKDTIMALRVTSMLISTREEALK